MSTKNRPENKKLRRLERALRKGRLPRYFDVVHWLKDRGYANTTGQAIQLLLDGKVVSESHALGKQIIETPGPTKEFPDREARKEEVFRRHYPVDILPTVTVKEND